MPMIDVGMNASDKKCVRGNQYELGHGIFVPVADHFLELLADRANFGVHGLVLFNENHGK